MRHRYRMRHQPLPEPADSELWFLIALFCLWMVILW